MEHDGATGQEGGADEPAAGKSEGRGDEAEEQAGKAGSNMKPRGGGNAGAAAQDSGNSTEAGINSSDGRAQDESGSSAAALEGRRAEGGAEDGAEEHTGEGGKGQHDDGRAGGGTISLVCGPPPMVERACLPALRELGFDEEHIVVF